MRYTHYLYIVPFALLAACNSEEQISGTDSSGKEAIVLSAGIVEGAQQAVTRAGANPESGEKSDNHTTHLTLTNNTKLVLRVSGSWTHNSSTTDVIKNTTATVGTTTGTDNLHNDVTCDPTLYWDDYGTADPDNTTGRNTGLTIYGVAIDGKTSVPSDLTSISTATVLSSWQALNWTLPTDQSASGNTPADKDLLISNNVSSATEDTNYPLDCGTYKFDQTNRAKLLEFHHAMSKITVYLKPGDGFNGAFTSTEVKLTSNDATTSISEWPLTTCKVNVTDGTISEQTINNVATYSPSVVTMGTGSLPDPADGYTVAKEALVVPGSDFSTDDNAIIAKINADDNIYYVTAAKIRAAIDTYYGSTTHGYTTQPGFNYIIKVKVNKTDIQVTATVVEWTEITSDTYEPVINVSASYGGSVVTTSTTTNAFTKDKFSFYRSTSMDTGYGVSSNGFYAKDSEVSHTEITSTNPNTHTWTMSPQLYWPNHNTHYQFRGVWPQTVTTTDDGNYTEPRVQTIDEKQVIKVKNVAFTSGFPSELMIGRPDVETTATCSNSDHEAKNLWSDGICATEGKINLKFEYMMSKVKVELSTSASGSSEYVNLTGAKVELVNAYTTGNVKLGDMGVIQTGSTGTYEMHVDGSNTNDRLDAIVPQSFTNNSGKLKFRITIMDGSTVADVYEANVESIDLYDKNNTKITPAATAWESGHYYIYKLKITKTEVKVTATLTDWTEVTAQQNVWF